jgi:Porin subfamily
MTLMKSLLLGSAAGIVAVATAQAADLPTRKAAPVEYVRVCNVGGITGWTLPGSDTCVKLSGYITAQVVGGNLNTQFAWGTVGDAVGAIANTPGIAGLATNPTLLALGATDPRNTQRVLLAASSFQQNTTFYRPETGWSTRANLSLDLASNTAYGPLLGHAEVQGDVGNGLDSLQGAPVNNIFYVNTAYVTWAGITAGKAASFFSFVGGGDNYANFFSPDRKGFNEPLLLAYTASFGGGFTATLSAESPASVGASGGGTTINGATGCAGNGGCVANPNLITFGGQKWPDIVGALHVKQGWGEAQISGVIHNVNVDAVGPASPNFDPAVAGVSCGTAAFPALCDGQQNHVGWAIDAGVKINLQGWGGMFAAGDDLLLTGVYSQSAVWYSGLLDGMWGENGQTNGNGQPMFLADAFFNPVSNQWSTPRAWSVSALLEHHWTPTIYTDFEASIGGVEWSNMGGGCNFALPTCLLAQAASGPLSPRALSWIIGADVGWNPVTNLNFDLELMYQATTQTAPSGFLGTVYNTGGVGGPVFVPGDWRGNSNGFAGRLRITRYF